MRARLLLAAALSLAAPTVSAQSYPVSFVKSGKLRGLMVTDAMRWNAISDVANAKEAGLPAVQVIVTSFVATAIPGTSLRAE